jgi:uncharacterized surface anchored protein
MNFDFCGAFMPSIRNPIRSTPYAVAAALALAVLFSACTESTGVGGTHRVEGMIVFDAGGPPQGSPALTGRLPMRGAVVSLGRAGVSLSATSDGDGRFAFDGLTAGRWRLDVAPPTGYTLAAGQPSPWFVDLTESGNAPALQVLLANASDVGTIAAPVTVDGVPWVGFAVAVFEPGSDEALVTGLTQDSGVATISIGPGTYDVGIQVPAGFFLAPGGRARVTDVSVAAGETTWVVGFAITSREPRDPTSAVVFGNAVLDEGVDYVPGVTVALEQDGTVVQRTTDAFGGFSFEELEPGDWHLTVTPPTGFIPADGATPSSTLSLVPGDSVYLRIELANADGSGSLLGQALAAQGDSTLPVQGATIRALDPSSGDVAAEGVTGSNPSVYQSVRLSLQPGVYDVEVVPPVGYRVAPGTPARLEGVRIQTGRLAFVTFELEEL